MIRIKKTHAKDASGLYKAGEIYEEKDVESLAFKLEVGLVEHYKESKTEVKTKEEKKVSKRKTK